MKRYTKVMAIKVDHYESEIIDERNLLDKEKIEEFRLKYEEKDDIVCIVVHM